MKKLFLILFALITLSACSQEVLTQEYIETFNIGHEYKDCVGVGPQKCLVVNGDFFYSNIEGFEYEEGYEYVLKVKKTERENIPADASKYLYSLVEVIEKKAIETVNQNDLIGSWQWSEAENEDEFVATFTEDNFSSTTDCNNVFGDYTIEGSELSFGLLASTKKACLGEVREAEYIQILSEVQSYEINGSELILNLKSGSMLFNKK